MSAQGSASAPPPARVLIVRLGAVGDVVRTLPALRALRRTWPGARIAWAVETGAAPLLHGHPDLDALIVLDRGGLLRAIRRGDPGALRVARSFAGDVRAFEADLALDFQSSLKSGFVLWLSRAPRRLGFARGASREGAHIFANEHVTPPSPRQHRVLRALSLARAAGALDGPVEADLALTKAEEDDGAARVRAWAGTRIPVALAPFSSRKQMWKRYPLERWADVARALGAAGAAVLVLTGPGEANEARALCEAAGPHAIVADPGGLRALAATIAACRLLVGGDTGPMHLAWACGLPVVAVYGPTDPALNAPWGAGHAILAPPAMTSRDSNDAFPGITPSRIVEPALAFLRAPQGRDFGVPLGAREDRP